MTFSEAITRLGFETQAAAAEFLGVSDRTIRSYIAGESTPRATMMLLALMIATGKKPAQVNRLVDKGLSS